MVGFASGDVAQAPTNQALMANYDIVGVYFGAYNGPSWDAWRRDIWAQILAHYRAGRLRPFAIGRPHRSGRRRGRCRGRPGREAYDRSGGAGTRGLRSLTGGRCQGRDSGTRSTAIIEDWRTRMTGESA